MDLLINGLIDFTWVEYIIYTLIVTQITIMAITLYLHRGICHSAIDIRAPLAHFFRFWLWFTTSMKTADWVAIHRKHHAKVETIDDPHSPIVHGINTVLFRGADLYAEEKANEETIKKYSHNCPNDWIEHKIYSGKSNLGILFLFILNILMFGVVGIIIWAIQMMWTPIFAAGGINGVGHYYGYRNFDTADESTNMMPIAFFIGGEELHNNHHAYPTAAKFSYKPWEFDIGWLYIKIFSIIGLVKVKRLAPKTIVEETSKELDSETAYALLRSKILVITNYTKKVINPIMKKETKSASNELKKLIKKSKTSFLRQPDRISNQSITDLQMIFNENNSLSIVYNLKNKLHSILNSKYSKLDKFKDTINEWCLEAKSQGIDDLNDFSESLKGYKIV
ncbi:MAG: fatty acid desaturase [Pseudomonadota bacterium]|nr:fatty acid desaturase [Pseudomonadota bacterium]|tara:strand:- start:1934 stop:3112 length:1179 start_codon:yes stop_codon:yes gene_type:complete